MRPKGCRAGGMAASQPCQLWKACHVVLLPQHIAAPPHTSPCCADFAVQVLARLTEASCAEVDDFEQHGANATVPVTAQACSLALGCVSIQQQQVLRLDVPVHYVAVIMRVGQELQQLTHHFCSIPFTEVTLHSKAQPSTATCAP